MGYLLYDGFRGVLQQIHGLKRKLIWQFLQLCFMGIASHNSQIYATQYYNIFKGLPCHNATSEVIEIEKVLYCHIVLIQTKDLERERERVLRVEKGSFGQIDSMIIYNYSCVDR